MGKHGLMPFSFMNKEFLHNKDGRAIRILMCIILNYPLKSMDMFEHENLGLYEMVRRRCRFIVISDAGRDPDFAFEDLGNAVRKISIDLGVPIRFEKLERLKRRPQDVSQIAEDCDYHAVAEIDYQEADGNVGVENGLILYIKTGYHGTESAGVRSYAMANLDFPHQSTANQWFSESQFESYRALGEHIVWTVSGTTGTQAAPATIADLFARAESYVKPA